MTIDREGFLSADISTWIEKHRKENREWFELASDLNRVAHQQLALLEIPSEDNKAFTAALLFIRGLSNFQGAILTAEKGMTVETGTLARSCFETVFYLGALSRSPEFIKTLIADDADRRGKIARSLLKLPENSGLEQEHLEKLNRFLAGVEESDITAKPIQIFDMAVCAHKIGEINFVLRFPGGKKEAWESISELASQPGGAWSRSFVLSVIEKTGPNRRARQGVARKRKQRKRR